MALIYNGKTLGPSAVIKYAGVALQKIVYKGVTVWQKYTSSSARISSYYAIPASTPTIAGSASPSDPTGYIYNRGTMSGNALSWSGAGACVKANCACTLTVSGFIRPHGILAETKGWYYKNNTQLAQIFYVYTTDQKFTLSYKIKLAAGDTFSIRTAVTSGHAQFEVSATFSAEPV